MIQKLFTSYTRRIGSRNPEVRIGCISLYSRGVTCIETPKLGTKIFHDSNRGVETRSFDDNNRDVTCMHGNPELGNKKHSSVTCVFISIYQMMNFGWS
ncbi:hypothetical protein HN51_044365 [Arachis hypogaea]